MYLLFRQFDEFLWKAGMKSRRCIMSQLVSGIQGWMMLIVLVSAPV